MKTKLFTRILFGLLLSFSSVMGQDIVVNLKILPPYPTKITDYQSNPQMVILTVSNVSTAEKQVQLKGTIVGENGISVSVKPNYKSSSPLTIAAGATVSLNGNALASIFDFNQLLYTGITAQEAIRKNGLPEGFYTVCVDAYDYNNLSVKLNSDGGMSCSALNISNVEPPTIIAPFNTQVLNNNGVQAFPITWSTPPGSPPTLQYTVKIVEILGNRNPNDAMLTTRPIYEKEVMTNTVIYGPTDYQLVEGRSYAIMVVAKDPFDKVTFRNQGRSEVYMFTYGQKKVEEPVSAPLIAQGGRVLDCNCKTSVSNQSVMDVRNKTAQEIGTIRIGEFDLLVKDLVSANANGLTGSGSIKLPTFLSGIPVLVTFKDLRINSAKQVISGQAIASLSEGTASLLPTYDPSKPNSTMNTSQLANFKNHMADPQKLFKNLNPLDQIGYKLPLGIDKTIGNKKTVLSITQMIFDAHQAVFDAGFVLDMPDATPNMAALGASNVCFNKAGLCGQGRLYLAEDLSLNLSGSDIALKAKRNGNLPTDSGTYVVFDQQGFSRLRIQGEYSFSQNLIKANGGGIAKATIVADAVSWTDWIASVTLSAFQMANNADFVFKPTTLFYDHSDTRNPNGLPADYQEGKVSQWRGFFAPSLQIELPAVLKQGNSNALSIQSKNLIIDDRGVTGNLAAAPVFTLGNGSLASWSCSLDLVEVNFKYNSFVNGKLKGKVLLPFTDQQKTSSQLIYSSTISSDPSGLKYNFTIEQANTLEVPMWMARFRLDNSSIVVNAGTGIATNAMLTMNGSLSIVTKMPVVGNVDFDLVSFKDLKFGTSAPYFEQGTATFGQSSPPKFVGGFPITLSKAPSLATGDAGEIGLHFPIAINLADMASLPKAEVAFSVFGKFSMNGSKVNFGFSRVRADSITVDGKIGAFTVNGKLFFFENDQKWGDGIEGSLQVGFFSGVNVRARGLFGRRDYSYWFLDARLNINPGIVIGPGISLFGFGGGAYYNLSQNSDPKRAVSYTFAEDQIRTMYSPSKGLFGFKAGVNLGTSDGSMLLLMGDIAAEVNYQSFALEQLTIKANGAMFAPPPGFDNIKNAMAKAGADIVYDFKHSTFSALAKVDIDYQEIIKAHSELSIYSGPDGWHFKIGDAGTPSTWTSIEMMKIFRGAFYMNVGNKDMSYSPRMQELMSKIFPGGNTDKPSGLFFGAEQKLVDIDLKFLIFYLKLTAGFDFDVALLNTRGSKIECDGRTNIGLDGYYAMGRAEAYVSGEFGLFVDVWFFEGKVCAGRLGVKAGMEVGLPNPTWLAGWVEADYSVLGGAISGKMRFKASVGTKCTVAVNPFAGLPIISELKPADNEKKVSILSDMTAALNYYVNREFEVATTDEEGNNRNLKFKAVIKSITLNGGSFSANYTNTVNDITGGNARLVLKRDKEAIFYGWEEALPANTKMELVVVAEGYQWQNNRWVLIAGSEQEERASFTTGTCPKTFENTADGVQIVVGSYPFKGQQFFTPKHENKGYIWLKLALPCLATSNQGVAGTSKTLAVFRSLTDTVEVPVTMEGNKLTYSIPPNLKASTMYRMQIVHRISPPSMSMLATSLSSAFVGQTNNAQTFVGNPNFASSSSSANNAPSNTALNNAAVGVQVNQSFQQSFTATQQLSGGSTIQTAVSSASSNMRTKEEVMYTLYFKTSKYQSLEEKVNAFNVSRKINAEAMNLANFDIRSSEEFDEYELHGWNYPGATANYIIAPLLEFREKLTTNTWINKHVRDVSGHFHGLARFAEFPTGIDFDVDIRPKINEAYFWDPTQYAIAQVRMKQRNITAPVAQKRALTAAETRDFEQKLNPYKRLIDMSSNFIGSSVAVQSSALRAMIK